MSSVGATSVDGLFSGLDTTSLITSLANVRRAPIAVLTKRVTERTTALTSYQSLSAQVLALQSTATTIAEGSMFQARTVDVSDTDAILASAGSGAALGSYEVEVEHLAAAHKLTGGTVADANAALGYSGDFRLNGQTISLTAADTLFTLRDAINRAGAGVSAAVLNVSSTDHRLVLTSLQTGADNALDLVDASSSGFLTSLGLVSGAATTKHALASGMASDTLGSRLEAVGTALDLTAPAAGTIQINGVDVAVDLASDSLQDLADRITAAAIPGVTATVETVTEGSTTGYRLHLTGDSGAPALADAGGVLQTLGVLTKAPAHELQAAQDARILVDGYAVERATNHIDDALEGLSLDLLTETTGPVTVTVAGNPEQAVSGLQQLMNSYNGIVRTLNSGLEYDSETKTGGVFFGDQTILGLQSGLYQASLGPVSTLGGAWTLPSQLGLQVDSDGLLTCNLEKLRSALAEDPDGVLRLLTSRAETSSDAVEFVSATPDTADSGAAGYAVQITQAATRATTTSAALAGGITRTETLTFGGRYSVTLQAGDTLERAAERLNAVFSGNGLGLTASVVDNRLQVQSRFWGSHYQVRVKSSLDQGQGGTDLGGATAGTERAVTGQDVAGTIGGKAATGWGQWLTGDAGKAKGLKLKVTATATGDHGTVQVSKGVASRLASYASQLTATETGNLTLATEAVSETITDLKTSIADMEEDVQTFIDTMKERFAVAEGILAKNSALQSYLTAQLGALTKSTKSTSA